MKRTLIAGSLAIAILTALTLTPAATQPLYPVEANTESVTQTCLARPLQPWSGFASLVSRTGTCDDYASVCEDVAYREMRSCDYWGLGDCFCKGQRAYNKCMSEVNCPGISAEAMQAQGCTCLNKSCIP